MDTSFVARTKVEGVFNSSHSENEHIDYLTVANASGNTSFGNGTAPAEFNHFPVFNYLVVTVLNVLVFIVGVVGNMLVICVVCRVRAMRNPTNYFLFTLSLADMLVLLICQPVALSEFYTKQRWYIGEFMCKSIFCLIFFFNLAELVLSLMSLLGFQSLRHLKCYVTTSC